MTLAIVVMGVTGCGKSTLGAALADALSWRFIEGDALHPPQNVRKMQAGIPLDDADREPFLRNVAGAIVAKGQSGVVASCSALKRRYRDLIRRHAGEVRFVLPVLDQDVLVARLTRRKDHFMPASLLDSQLEELEMPAPEERAILVDGTLATRLQTEQVLAALGD